MRCPNCGNENPPDYLFCDECGARLLGSDVATATSGPLDAANEADAGGGGGGNNSGPMQDNTGNDMGGAMADYVDYSMGAGGPAPSDMSYGSDTGNSGSMDSADTGTDADMPAVPVAEDTMSTDQGAAPTEEAPAMPDVIKPLPSLASAPLSSEAAPDSAAPAPAQDDTMGAGSAAYEDAQESVSGISDDARMSVEEGMADMTGISGAASSIGSMPESTYGQEEEAVPAPSGDTSAAADMGTMGGPAGNEWAANALDLLNQATSAAASGDWGAFGNMMNSLKSALQAAAGGAPSSLSHVQRIEPAMSANAGAAMTDMSASSPSASWTDTGPSATSMAASDSVASYESPAMDSMSGSTGMDAGYMGQPAATMDSDMSAGTGGTPSGPMDSSMSPVIPTVTPMAQAAPQAAPASTGTGARLILISTGAEMTLPDQEEITVGREDPSSGIFPDVDLTPHGGEDGGVSRRHARLLHVGDDYFVEDLQSTNFTKLDGQRLPAHVRERLEDGARLDFGRVAMIFRRG